MSKVWQHLWPLDPSCDWITYHLSSVFVTFIQFFLLWPTISTQGALRFVPSCPTICSLGFLSFPMGSNTVCQVMREQDSFLQGFACTGVGGTERITGGHQVRAPTSTSYSLGTDIITSYGIWYLRSHVHMKSPYDPTHNENAWAFMHLPLMHIPFAPKPFYYDQLRHIQI